jgi:hypothetical protein
MKAFPRRLGTIMFWVPITIGLIDSHFYKIPYTLKQVSMPFISLWNRETSAPFLTTFLLKASEFKVESLKKNLGTLGEGFMSVSKVIIFFSFDRFAGCSKLKK